MKTLYEFDAFYNGRTAKVEATGEREALVAAIEIFKPAKHRQPAIHVTKGDAVGTVKLSSYGHTGDRLNGVLEDVCP